MDAATYRSLLASGDLSLEEELAARLAQDSSRDTEDEEEEARDAAASAESQRVLDGFYGHSAFAIECDEEEAEESDDEEEDDRDDWKPGRRRKGGRRKAKPGRPPKVPRKAGRPPLFKPNYRQMLSQTASLEEQESPFQPELSASSSSSRLGKPQATLPEALEALLGQANVTAAMGRPEEAITMIESIIREHANSYAPYQALATIYDSVGDEEKQLQFGLMGAFLDQRTDGETWAELGRLSHKLGKPDQAVICFGKAVKLNELDLASWESRISLLNESKEVNLELKSRLSYLRILRSLNSRQLPFPEFRRLAQIVIKRFAEAREPRLEAAARTLYLEKAAEEDSADMDEVAEAVKLILAGPGEPELLHAEAARLLLVCEVVTLVNSGGHSIPYYALSVTDAFLTTKDREMADNERRNLEEGNEAVDTSPVSATLGENPLALLVQLIVSLVKLTPEDPNIIKALLGEFDRETGFNDASSVRIAETLQEEDGLADAAAVMEKALCGDLVQALPEAWETYGSIMEALGEADKAVDAFGETLRLDPGRVGARLALANLQSSAGDADEALETILSAEAELGTLKDPLLLKAEAELYVEKRMWMEFLKSACTLLAYHFVPILTMQSAKDGRFRVYGKAENGVSYALRQEFLRNFKNCWMDKLMRRADRLTKEAGQGRIATGMEGRQLYELAYRVCDTLWNERRYYDLMVTAGFCYLTPELIKVRLNGRFLAITLLAAVKAEDAKTAFLILREGYPNANSLRYWNAHAVVYSLHQDVMFHRYILRRAEKDPDNAALAFLAGNNSLISGTYSVALAEYLSVLRQEPNVPLLNLLAGLSLLHIACKKDVTQRHLVLLQSFAFLERYAALRRCPMETPYVEDDFGANILQSAVHFYKKVLAMEQPVEAICPDSAEVSGQRRVYDLRPSAAWNLALIYRHSGNEEMAFRLLHRFCRL